MLTNNTDKKHIWPKIRPRYNQQYREWGYGSVHPTPSITNRHSWHISYCRELIHLYEIVKRIVTEKYPTIKENWESNSLFNSFSRLIYNCSSKHISLYLDDPLDLEILRD